MRIKLSYFSKESIILLFEGSIRTIPFNAALALLLAGDLLFHKAPTYLVLGWISAMILSTAFRWFFCYRILKKKLYEKNTSNYLLNFIFLSTITGSIWGSCYWLMVPYIPVLQEFIIILVIGGMSTAAIASLSVYLPAYYAYIIPMVFPIIAYNYWLDQFDRTILGTMFLLFSIVLLISAKINNYLFNQIFRLTKEKEALIDDLKVLSVTDSLTGLYNRRYFETILKKEWDLAYRNRYSLVLVSIDVDNFKLINDNYGHLSGDDFLIFFAELLKKTFRRANDIICRVGGDEFSIILSNQSINDALAVCNLLHDKFFKEKPKNWKKVIGQITLSIGISYNQFKFKTNSKMEQLITDADEALYQSKKEGKNQIIVKDFIHS